MRKLTLAAVVATAAIGVSVSAQQKVTELPMGKGGSGRAKVEAVVDGANISIEYGRPALKGRVPGKDIDPYEGKPWRTGADAQTTLITDRPLTFGTLKVPAGTYGIHTIPQSGTWQLIIHKREKGWGIPYPGEQDELGRVPMTMGKVPKAEERLTISIEDTAQGGMLHIDWGQTRASAAFTVGG
jgi:hypothetical protein